MGRKSTRYEGVYFRERKGLFNGRKDRTYEFCRTEGRRQIWTKVGRASEGVTLEAAYQARAAAVLEAAAAKTPAPDPKVGELAELLAEDYKRRLPETSSRPRIASIRRELGPGTAMGEARISELTAGRLDDWLSALGERVRPATIRCYAVFLRKAASLGAEAGLCGECAPLKRMRLPKSDNASQRWLTDDECDRLLGALPGEWRDLAEVSLLTGLRMGELKRLRGHDVSGESATCSFIGKSGKRETAPLTDRALEILLSRARGPAPLFGPVHDRVFYRAVDLCGLNPEGTDPRMRVRFHTFRHTFASRLVQAGVDLYLVQRLMRHSSPAMTQRYAHLRSADLRAALAKALPTRIA